MLTPAPSYLLSLTTAINLYLGKWTRSMRGYTHRSQTNIKAIMLCLQFSRISREDRGANSTNS